LASGEDSIPSKKEREKRYALSASVPTLSGTGALANNCLKHKSGLQSGFRSTVAYAASDQELTFGKRLCADSVRLNQHT
jgi:hypothetical protein